MSEWRNFTPRRSGNPTVSVAQLASVIYSFVYPRSGNPIPASTLQTILRNRLYTGRYEWNGKRYQGKHEPLISVEL